MNEETPGNLMSVFFVFMGAFLLSGIIWHYIFWLYANYANVVFTYTECVRESFL